MEAFKGKQAHTSFEHLNKPLGFANSREYLD
jgi:hypothetical protein